MSNPKPSSGPLLMAVVAAAAACGGTLYWLHGEQAWNWKSWMAAGSRSRSEPGLRDSTRHSSPEVTAQVSQLQELHDELDRVFTTPPRGGRPGAPREPDVLQQRVQEVVDRADAILQRDDVSGPDRTQSQRIKLHTLCKAAIRWPSSFAGPAQTYCQQLVAEAPGTDEAAEALGYVLARKYLVDAADVDADAKQKLTQYARDYPQSEMPVALFLKISQRLAFSQPAEAIRLSKLGVDACAGHKGVHQLREQLARLEAPVGAPRPSTTRVSRGFGPRFHPGRPEYGGEPSRLLGMQMRLQGPLLRGGSIRLDRYRGKVVLIDFWATWCGPCRASLPGIRRLRNQYQEEGLVVIGISLDTDRDQLREFVLSNDLDWPQIFISPRGQSGWQNPLAVTYDVEAIPQTFLVSRRGQIVAVGLRGVQLERAIRSELQR